MHGSLLLKLLGVSFAHPLDGGARLVDGQPLFGPSKTIRGIVLTAGGCLVGAVLTGSLIPAVWHYLEMKDNEVTAWRFVNATDVPLGPWTEIITTLRRNAR